MSRVSSKAPGAMHGVSQIEGQIYFNKPLGPSSAEVKHPKRRSAAGTTPEIALHQGQMRRAWAALSHPYVRMCFNEMVKRLLAGSGIVVYHGSEPKTPCDAFRTILMRDFIPFSRDALDHIMAFGIVPIAFRKVAGNGLGENELVPYVPKFGTYTISTWTEAGLQVGGAAPPPPKPPGLRAFGPFSHVFTAIQILLGRSIAWRRSF